MRMGLGSLLRDWMDTHVLGCALTPYGHVVPWTTWRGLPLVCLLGSRVNKAPADGRETQKRSYSREVSTEGDEQGILVGTE